MQTPAISDIFSHIPAFVWAILALILVMGLLQSRDQWMARRRLMGVPTIWLAYGIWGVVSSFGYSATAVLPWVLGLLASLSVVRRSGWPTGSRFDSARGQFFVPGSWLPLVLMMGIFLAKFAVGMSAAMHPDLLGRPEFMATFSATFGAFGGAFLGRSRNILNRATSSQSGQLETP
ncbi:hypothetical protein LNV09_12320 [Paucibacter sp. B2R-40]|uniref:DUF6622 family protein n=1 Tax=Paucibacter sp. B2R-40 TaxID=2893554 RepID=UPI0021E4F7B5|nr:DUF6622 family protein [Paucibacter sp. B2R-40]MCV2354940.1 hypothetical protein [Paucibacter sp. B2R-40]